MSSAQTFDGTRTKMPLRRLTSLETDREAIIIPIESQMNNTVPFASIADESMADLTLAGIESIDDVMDAFDLAEEYGVPVGGLDSLDDVRERLRLHYGKMTGGSHMTLVSKG
jgi:hypothetical protein